MAGRELDRNAFGIPARAWVIAIATIVLATAAVLAMPGPAIEGCLYQKSCYLAPRGPLLLATAVLVLGSALSIWIGGVPRHWVAGWSATLGGIVAIIAGLFIAFAIPGAVIETVRVWALAGGLCFFSAWAVQLPFGLVAASVPSPFRPRMPKAELVHDDRPRWLQDIGAAIALLECESSRASDLQHVAELAFELGNDPRLPTAVRDHAERMRVIFASTLEGRPLHDALLAELRKAACVGAQDPYRVT